MLGRRVVIAKPTGKFQNVICSQSASCPAKIRQNIESFAVIGMYPLIMATIHQLLQI
jgi:hypothetical protein